MGSCTENSAFQEVPDFASRFMSSDCFGTKPLKGLRVGVIRETMRDGVDQAVKSSINAAAAHLEDPGCSLAVVLADELGALYGDSRAKGFGDEVRTVVKNDFKAALDEHDILISPAAPYAAYKIGEKKNDPLAMYAGDSMTVSVNLAGLPALVVPCEFVEVGSAPLPVRLQMIGSAFSEEKLLKAGHIFKQTLKAFNFIAPLVADSLVS